MTRTETVYQFVKSFHAKHGYAPTRREIGRACHISSSSVVNYYLRALHDAGRLTVTRFVSRGIVLTEEADNADWLHQNAIARG